MMDNSDITMPTSRGKTFVQYYYNGVDAGFICGADGHVTSGMLDNIEEEINEYRDEVGDIKDAGDYLFQVWWENPQYGEEGRTEIEGHFEISKVLFEPIVKQG
jgi:hypothetical protein